MEDIIIKRARLKRGDRLDVTYIDELKNEVLHKGKFRVHEDLMQRLQELAPFLADLCEQKEADSIDWLDTNSERNKELLRSIVMTGVLKNDALFPTINLVGARRTRRGSVVQLVTPGISPSDDMCNYPHALEMDASVDVFFHECKLYVTENKHHVDQQEMDFDSDDPFGADIPDVPEIA